MAPVVRNDNLEDTKSEAVMKTVSTKVTMNADDSKRTIKSKTKELDKQELQDTAEKKGWYEDRNPGDGSEKNKFSAEYDSPRSPIDSYLDSSKNKSWFELVEADESENQIPSKTVCDTINEGTVPGVKIKQEVLDESDEGKKEKVCATDPTSKSDVTIKKEKIVEDNMEMKKNIVKQEKTDNVRMVKRERGTPEPAKIENSFEEKRLKKELENETVRKMEPDSEHTHCRVEKDAAEYANEDESEEQGASNARKRNRDGSADHKHSKRERNNSTSTTNSSTSSGSRKKEYETDPEILSRRQKQIDYGKNTVGYDRYKEQIPKDKRTQRHPRTPPKHVKYSRRAWDGIVKVWRQQLHVWDPPRPDGECDAMSDISVTISNTSDDYDDSHDSRPASSTPGSLDNMNDDCLDLGQD